MTDIQRVNGFPVRSALLAAAIMLAAPLAQAQQPTPPGAAGQPGQQPSSKQQEFMQIRSQLQTIQKELGQIQEEVLNNNPDLQQRQQDFRDLMMTTMQDQGATPESDVNRLKTLQAELQKQDIPKDKRQKLIKEFRETNMALQQAQKQAMQEKEVQEAQKSLNDAMLTAMVDANPETQKLLDKMKQARQKLMQMQQQMGRGGGAPAPGN